VCTLCSDHRNLVAKQHTITTQTHNTHHGLHEASIMAQLRTHAKTPNNSLHMKAQHPSLVHQQVHHTARESVT
jgi:hypothetical protein